MAVSSIPEPADVAAFRPDEDLVYTGTDLRSERPCLLNVPTANELRAAQRAGGTFMLSVVVSPVSTPRSVRTKERMQLYSYLTMEVTSSIPYQFVTDTSPI